MHVMQIGCKPSADLTPRHHNYAYGKLTHQDAAPRTGAESDVYDSRVALLVAAGGESAGIT